MCIKKLKTKKKVIKFFADHLEKHNFQLCQLFSFSVKETIEGYEIYFCDNEPETTNALAFYLKK